MALALAISVAANLTKSALARLYGPQVHETFLRLHSSQALDTLPFFFVAESSLLFMFPMLLMLPKLLFMLFMCVMFSPLGPGVPIIC